MCIAGCSGLGEMSPELLTPIYTDVDLDEIGFPIAESISKTNTPQPSPTYVSKPTLFAQIEPAIAQFSASTVYGCYNPYVSGVEQPVVLVVEG